jgi:hypothetical protein
MTALAYPGKRQCDSELNNKETLMRALISALAITGLFTVALPSYADDANDKPIDGGPVKSGGLTYDPTMGGRSPFIDDGTVKSGGATGRPGRAVDDGKAKAGGATAEPRRTADEPKVTQTKKKKSKKAKTPATAPTN